MSNPIEIERAGGRVLIRFVRPEMRNPLSSEVLAEIEEVVESIAGDTSVERLVFTGTGDVFASGADLNEIGRLTSETAADFGRRGQALMNRIEQLPFMTAAAINGFCFGGALDLALACRTRVSSAEASFCHPGAGLGIITGWGGTQRLPRLIGQAWAMEMLFTASPISAKRALEIGLVDAVGDDPVAALVA